MWNRILVQVPMLLVAVWAWPNDGMSENWSRWRGPNGNAVSSASRLPVRWSATKNIRWKVRLPGEGSSSPIVSNDRIFLTAAFEDGTRRALLCLDGNSGETLWKREVDDRNPELASALTGHAAPTPVTDGRRVVALFGNAGVVCYDFQGQQLWRRRFGEFESELGLASSPILSGGRVILVCDHDGDRFKTFDSFLIALDLKTGKTFWKTERPGLYRSWSTPILVPVQGGKQELIVNAQDELRAYNPDTGQQLWKVRGMTGWVTPSAVYAQGLVFACSGKDGPTMAVRPGGRGDVTGTNIVWLQKRGAPYVCSPLFYHDQLYVHNEMGILTCYEATTGKVQYRRRIAGKFFGSGIAGDGKIYLTNDQGTTYVVQAGINFRLLAENRLDEECLTSPAVRDSDLLIRTRFHLYCVGSPGK